MQAGIYLWLMRDSPPPHYLLAVQEFLNNMFLEQWIGGGGPTAWLAHSCGLNPLDFYHCGHLEPAVYAKEVTDIWDFQQ